MCGSETFEMLVSSSSMNVAIVTTSAIAHGLCADLLAGASAVEIIRGAAIAAILWAPLTCRDAADDRDPVLGRTQFAPAGAAPPSRSCRSRFRPAAG